MVVMNNQGIAHFRLCVYGGEGQFSFVTELRGRYAGGGGRGKGRVV